MIPSSTSELYALHSTGTSLTTDKMAPRKARKGSDKIQVSHIPIVKPTSVVVFLLLGLPEVGNVVQNLLQTHKRPCLSGHYSSESQALRVCHEPWDSSSLRHSTVLGNRIINKSNKHCDLHTCLSTSRVLVASVEWSCWFEQQYSFLLCHRTLSSVWSARGPFLSSVVTLAFLSVPNWRWFNLNVLFLFVTLIIPRLFSTGILTRIHDVLSGNILVISEPLLLHWPRSQSAAVSLSTKEFATSLLHSPNHRFVVAKRVCCFGE